MTLFCNQRSKMHFAANLMNIKCVLMVVFSQQFIIHGFILKQLGLSMQVKDKNIDKNTTKFELNLF